MDKEYLIAAAIEFTNKKTQCREVWLGKRHNNVFEDMFHSGIEYDRATYIQGFFTNRGRFVNRYEAKDIAVAANQLIVPIEDTFKELYSEDVW